jgi:hypothetical protein
MANRRLVVYLFAFIAFFFLGIYLDKIARSWGGAFLGRVPGYARCDRPGEPVGGDFTLFYSASALARSGPPEAVYDFSRLRETEQRLFGPSVALPWPYPPVFLLLVAPLALLPYLSSLALWLLTTLAAYLLVVRRTLPHPLTLWLTLAFPGTFVNFLCGQNGFLSAALVGGGLLRLERCPRAAGVLLGLMSYKPHLAVLLPVALLAGRRWQTLRWAALTALGLAALSAAVFGFGVWQSFFRHIFFSVQMLQESGAPWSKMPSFYAAVQQLGGSFLLSALAQGLAMAAGLAAVVWLWGRAPGSPPANAALVLGALMFPPHVFNYDLALLALPLAWLARDGSARGFLPWEPALLILAWGMPLLYVPLEGDLLHIPLGPGLLALLLGASVWRYFAAGRLTPGAASDGGPGF